MNYHSYFLKKVLNILKAVGELSCLIMGHGVYLWYTPEDHILTDIDALAQWDRAWILWVLC